MANQGVRVPRAVGVQLPPDQGREAPERGTPLTVLRMAHVEVALATYTTDTGEHKTSLVFFIGGVPHFLPEPDMSRVRRFHPKLEEAMVRRKKQRDHKMSNASKNPVEVQVEPENGTPTT